MSILANVFYPASVAFTYWNGSSSNKTYLEFCQEYSIDRTALIGALCRFGILFACDSLWGDRARNNNRQESDNNSEHNRRHQRGQNVQATPVGRYRPMSGTHTPNRPPPSSPTKFKDDPEANGNDTTGPLNIADPTPATPRTHTPRPSTSTPYRPSGLSPSRTPSTPSIGSTQGKDKGKSNEGNWIVSRKSLLVYGVLNIMISFLYPSVAVYFSTFTVGWHFGEMLYRFVDKLSKR